MGSEEAQLRSVGNTLQLHESAVVEACNLKFAIEYQMKNGQFLSILNIQIIVILKWKPPPRH
jgi:hypothetical protein